MYSKNPTFYNSKRYLKAIWLLWIDEEMKMNLGKIVEHRILLLSGFMSSLIYLLTDIISGNMYSGYSFNEQAVSELFAIGSPVAPLVVVLFSISSIFVILFAISVFMTCRNRKLFCLLTIMLLGNAIDSLILWNFFPMHMRNVPPTFTDTMHTILAINPFILISIIIGVFMYKGWFRYYSLLTILILFIPAFVSFSYIPLLLSHQPTPWMGFTERVSQYGHLTWLAVLSIVLFKKYKR